MPLRLSDSTIGTALPGTIVPGYDRAALPTGIVHLGLGAFVRAHMATYTDDLLAIEPGPWGIAGVSLKRPDQRDRLAPQDCLYTALQRDGTTTTPVFWAAFVPLLSHPKIPLASSPAWPIPRVASSV